MAKIGLQYCAYAPYYENPSTGEYWYGPGKRGRKMLNADRKLNFAEAILYGDDDVAEYEKQFIDGDMAIQQDEFTDEMRVDLLDNKATEIQVNGESLKEISSTDADNPPYVGFGFIEVKVIDKQRKYQAQFYKKVIFSEPDESAQSKQQSISFQTPTINAKILKAIDGTWREKVLCSSLATAIAWLSQKLNLPPVTSLKTLIVGPLELTPAFSREITSYTATTENDSDIIVASPVDSNATVLIDLNDGTPVTNGSAATWAEGENTLEITVTNGTATKVYTVTVTKESSV